MIKFFFIALISIFALPATAQNIHFFGSIKGSKTTIENDDIKFDDIKNKPTLTTLTTAGVSVDSNLTEKVQALAQFTLQNKSYINADLIQLRYYYNDDLLIRVGKQRTPFNLHSENIQVQALLPWMASPREVYGRNPIFSFTGGSIEKKISKSFGIHAYSGDTSDNFQGDTISYKVETKNLVGMRLNFQTNHFKSFVNHFRAEGDLNVTSDFSIANPPTIPTGLTASFKKNYHMAEIRGTTAGLSYNPRSFFIMSEYSLLSTKNAVIDRVDSAYVSIGKEINEKWVPVLTFSSDLNVASQLSPTKTTTYMANLNYRLDFNNILKFGIEHVNYKERTVSTSLGPSNGSVFTNISPKENFEIYSMMWAFVY